MRGPDLAIIFLIFLIAFSLDLALWRSTLMVKQFSGVRENSRKEADITTLSKYLSLKTKHCNKQFITLLIIINAKT